MIRVHSKGSELVLQVKKVVLCLLLSIFSPQSCPSSSNTEVLTPVLLWAALSMTHYLCHTVWRRLHWPPSLSDTEALNCGFHFKDLSVVLVLPKLPHAYVVVL